MMREQERRLEARFQAKLQYPRVVSVDRMKKRLPNQAVGGSGGVKLRLAAITTDDVVACVAGVSRICNTELGVVEDVEGFGPELEIASLAERLEVFQQRHVEVGPRRIAQIVAARVAEGEPFRRGKRSGVQ